MTIQDWAALASAPQRAFGTQISVRARPIAALGGHVDHMFDVFDDGQNQLIARGGPSEENGRYFSDLNRVIAEVTPEASSRDRGAPYRTIANRFLPGVSAEQAAAGARAHALGVDHLGNRYGLNYNSNGFAADVAEPMFGYRPGDKRTWGYDHPLFDGDSPPITRGTIFTGPLNPDDLTPIIRTPPY